MSKTMTYRHLFDLALDPERWANSHKTLGSRDHAAGVGNARTEVPPGSRTTLFCAGQASVSSGH